MILGARTAAPAVNEVAKRRYLTKSTHRGARCDQRYETVPKERCAELARSTDQERQTPRR
jgi:hypothetical protein